MADDYAGALPGTVLAEVELERENQNVVVPGGMNDSQLALEAQRLRPAIKVLLTSGYVSSLDEGQVIGLGEPPVRHNPYRCDELARSLRLVLGGEGR